MDGKKVAEFLGKMKREVATGDLRSEAGDWVKSPKLLEKQEHCDEGTIAKAMAAEFLEKMKREVATGGDWVKIPKLLEQQEHCGEGTIAKAMKEILILKAGAMGNIHKSYDAMFQVLSKAYPDGKWLPMMLPKDSSKDVNVDSLKRAYREAEKRFLVYQELLNSLTETGSPNTLWERFVLAVSKSKIAKVAQSR